MSHIEESGEVRDDGELVFDADIDAMALTPDYCIIVFETSRPRFGDIVTVLSSDDHKPRVPGFIWHVGPTGTRYIKPLGLAQ